MPCLSARLLLSLLVVCLPLQGWGVALARVAGAAHYHQAIAGDDEGDHGHAHGHGHHHDAIEHHRHDADDDGVVVVTDDARFASDVKSIAQSIRVLDVEPMPGLFTATPPAPRPGAAPCQRATAFTSHVVGVPERPPR